MDRGADGHAKVHSELEIVQELYTLHRNTHRTNVQIFLHLPAAAYEQLAKKKIYYFFCKTD